MLTLTAWTSLNWPPARRVYHWIKDSALEFFAIREERRTQRLRRLFHVQTHWMLADHLANHVGYVSKCLLEFLTSGKWNIAGLLRLRHHFGTAQTSGEEYES